MASSSTPRRPAPMARQTSTSSQVSQHSDPDLSATHNKPAPQKPQRQHVVGHSRMQRNLSTGKNLNKLNKAAQQQQQQQQQQATADAPSAKHHRRSHSGNANLNSVSSSPRPAFKRNASSGAIVRAAHQNHAQVALRKNHSSGHLARQAASKHHPKASKSDLASHRKPSASSGKVRRRASDEHPAVHFDMGDEEDDVEGQDDGWTEESASQSPTTTRSNTRSNSVILEPHKPVEPPRTTPERLRQINGGSSQHHSRPPDADMITSRLLQRNTADHPLPQMSTVAATAVSSANDTRGLGLSANSTMVDTPGQDLVSRFMDGDGSAHTPKGSSFLPSRNSPQDTGSEIERMRRNRSMPNFANSAHRASSHSHRSGASTPTDLPPSRTQQKLMLQRASSNIEPQKLIPAVLPRTGGPTFLNASMAYVPHGEGRLDPRLQQQFNHVAVEYKVVRRYRNPLADASLRIQQLPGVSHKARAPPGPTSRNGFANANAHGSSNLGTSFTEHGADTDGASVRSQHGRASLEDADARGRREDGRPDFLSSERERARNEAGEICRRLWESVEISEGD